jgi:uncharacterized protein (DUF169 family)
MIKQNEAGKTLYNMLSFQYKPLETKLLKDLPKEQIEMYQKLSYLKKIYILDGMAKEFGL